MKMKSLLVFLSLSATSLGAVAGDTADAALGGGIGGAIGAAIGNEVGGRAVSYTHLTLPTIYSV